MTAVTASYPTYPLMRGELNLHGWVYRFETGEVRAYNPEAHRFDAVEDVRMPSIQPVRSARSAANGP